MKHKELASAENVSAEDVPTFFDALGRCIPSGLTASAHRDTRRHFAITQPKIDYPEIHARITKYLNIADAMSAAEFEQRAESILESLRADSQTRNIAEGIRVPFLLPKTVYDDLGEAIEKTYLEAVGGAFSEKLPKYSFVNHHKGGLAGKLSIEPGSRHERLVQAMGQAQVVGYYFPCLTEYSVPAAIEQIASLPAKFLLAGGFDTSATFIGTPDLLLRTDGYPPLLWLAAMRGEKDRVGYHFEAYGYNLTFNRRLHFGEVAEYWASGLVVLG